MKILMEMRVEYILWLLQLIELRIKIQITILWLQYEQIKGETLTKLKSKVVLDFQNEFIMDRCFLDVYFHIVITIIIDELLLQHLESMNHHIQTMQMWL